MCNKSIQESREKVKNFVESTNFDIFIMSLICFDAVIFGLMTSDYFNAAMGSILFVLDRLCMAIFIVEMALKLFVYGHNFFKSKWNTFDFTVIAVSSFSFASYFIVLRTFRLFRLLKYINRFSKLRRLLTVLGALLPNFVAAMLVFMVLIYVFAIMGVSLFGDVFIEFATLDASLFALLQICTLDGWASEIARPVMAVFPHAWVFFVSFLLIYFLLLLSFVMSVIDEIVRQDLIKESANVAAAKLEADQKPALTIKKAPQAVRKKTTEMKRKSPKLKPAAKSVIK